jgi:Putative peptidoglycan binding domain
MGSEPRVDEIGGGSLVALKDADMGVKILGGLAAFALLLAVLSNGDPDNDAWGGGSAAGASASSVDVDSGDPTEDAWSEGAPDGGALPACDGTAPFAADGGTMRLPVYGPVTPFSSPDCQLDRTTGGDEATRLLQDALARCNGQPVAIDGVYGTETWQAVRAVQSQEGVQVDGTYGPETRGSMAWPIVSGDGEISCGATGGSSGG